MASEEIGLVLTHRHRLDNNTTTTTTTTSTSTTSLNHHSQLLFQDDSHSGFRCNPPHHHHRSDHNPTNNNTANSNKTTRELTGFIDHQHRYFPSQGASEFRRNMYNAGPANHRGIQNWEGGNGRASNSPSADGSDGDGEEDDDDDEDDDGDGDVEGLVNSSDNKNNNSSNTSGHSSGEKIVNANGKTSHISSFGLMRDVSKDGNALPSGNNMNDVRASSSDNHQQGQVSQYQNAVTIADPDGELYYSQYLQVADGSVSGLKDMVVENGCGFSGRKDTSYLGESGESLRAILSDPLTGVLMDDAMILPCGHSFGSGGMQHVMRTKTCYTCSHPVSDGSVASNLSLRSAVQAFRREEELQVPRASKRRRERSEQDKGSYGDSMLVDQPRVRGVQFPFSVTDRVIIKGNKRTPPRFVGREAVVTTQCLNGWYVVKTLDNAESVKLQYRSLAKVPDDHLPSKPASSKVTPSWLS